MCNDTEEWWKTWREIDLSFQNWHKEFDELWLKPLKVSKIYSLMGLFWPRYIIFELKKHRKVIFDDTGEWWQIWRKPTCGMENDMRNFTNFHQST